MLNLAPLFYTFLSFDYVMAISQVGLVYWQMKAHVNAESNTPYYQPSVQKPSSTVPFYYHHVNSMAKIGRAHI